MNISILNSQIGCKPRALRAAASHFTKLMDWYIPITIIPGIGMLILSTTNQMMALSGEIERLLLMKHNDFQHHIIWLKIGQLKRLTSSSTLFYTSAASFVLSAIFEVIFPLQQIGLWILAIGIAFTLLALALLVIYSYKAINIRKEQHQNNLKNHRKHE
ncbi:MAG: hypothetical protein MI975_09775 [Cytophagales bacterium]|nr:hypothetical protein [Cytophagales bacterium]